jgi:cyclin-dependent kinase 7
VYGLAYRAPELFFNATGYDGPAADCWAAGAIFGELLLRRPVFGGRTELQVLSAMFDALGWPTVETWPGMADLPDAAAFLGAQRARPRAPPLAAAFPGAPPEALELLAGLLCVDGARRLGAADALAHPYFAVDPPPTAAAALPHHRAAAAPPLASHLTQAQLQQHVAAMHRLAGGHGGGGSGAGGSGHAPAGWGLPPPNGAHGGSACPAGRGPGASVDGSGQRRRGLKRGSDAGSCMR